MSKNQTKYYLEHTDGHRKFYEIQAIYYEPYWRLQLRWGRISTKGRTQIQDNCFATENHALKYADHIIQNKLNKGYKIVDTLKKSEAINKRIEKKQSTMDDICLDRFANLG